MREGRVERKFNKVKKEIKEIRFLYFMPKHLEIQNNTFVKSIHRSFTFKQVISVPLTIIADFFRYQKHRYVTVTRRYMFDFLNKLNSNEKKPRNIVFVHEKDQKQESCFQGRFLSQWSVQNFDFFATLNYYSLYV